MLEKTLESPLHYKEIQPVSPKGNQPWTFIGRTDAAAEGSILWPTDAKNWLIGKNPDAGKDWREEENGTAEDEMGGWHHWQNGHEFKQALGVVMNREPWHAAVHGVEKSQTWLSKWTTSLCWLSPCFFSHRHSSWLNICMFNLILESAFWRACMDSLEFMFDLPW